MSNSDNNNISNALNDFFRSMARRRRHDAVSERNSEQRADVPTDPQQSTTVQMSDVVNEPDDGNETDSSMPILQDASGSDTGSDSGSDMDVELPPLEPVRPSSFRPQGTRRARVEDDIEGDSERDRRHPSRRASTPVTLATSVHPALRQPQTNSRFATVSPRPPSNPRPHSRRHHHYPMHLTAQMDDERSEQANSQPSPDDSGPNNNPSPQAESNDQPAQGTASRFGQILESLIRAASGQAAGTTFHTTVIPVGGVAGETNGNAGRFLGNLFTAMNSGEGGAFVFDAAFTGGGVPLFGFRPAHEREDPERAKVLVDGLEDVPVGLIRRLERISSESSGCAICWEKLLEDDAEYLKREEEERKEATGDVVKPDASELVATEATADQAGDQVPDNSASASTSSASSFEQSSTTKKKVPKYPRIVTLPCSHTFHADCLLPWFSRPHQTTCPTCRFNIDPDNLTWGAGARRRAAATTAVGGEETIAPTEGAVPPSDIPIVTFDPVIGMPVTSSENTRDLPQGNPTGSPSVVNEGARGPPIAPVNPSPVFPVPSAQGLRNRIYHTFSREPTNGSRSASNSSQSMTYGSSSLAPSTPSVANNSASSSSSASSPGAANINEGNESGSQASSSSSSSANTSSIPSDSGTIRREDLVYPNAPRMPRIEPRTLRPEQLRNLTQSIFGRIFGAEAPSQGPRSSNAPAQAQGAAGVFSAANNDASTFPRSTQTDTSNDSQPTTHPQHMPHNMHFHLPMHHPSSPTGDAFVTISFDIVFGPDANGSAIATGNTRTPQTDVSTVPTPSINAENENTSTAATSVMDDAGVVYTAPEGFTFSDLPAADVGIDDDATDTAARPSHSSENPPAAPTTQFGTPLPFPLAGWASDQPLPGGQRREMNARTPRSTRPPDFSNYINSMLGVGGPGRNGARRSQSNRGDTGAQPQSASRRGVRTRERRTWVPPPPPGLTLRQTIEKREREAGLRCWDVSCGVGPSDEDPFIAIVEEQKRQVRVRRVFSSDESQEDSDAKGKGKEKAEEESEPQYVCEHTFHPPCIVSAQRAALNGSEEVVLEEGKCVEVSCPVCRASGVVSREDWEEGVRALESGIA